jgi:hypothetical protein
LTPINFRVIQSDTFSKHTPGTGTWFINQPQFQKWLSGNNKVLWVEGIREYLTYRYFQISQLEKQLVLERQFSRQFFFVLYSFFQSDLSILLRIAPSLLSIFRIFSMVIMALPWSLRIVDIPTNIH